MSSAAAGSSTDSAGAAQPDPAFLAEPRSRVGASRGPQVARHPVNGPAIADWCDAIGDENPVYTDEEAAEASVHGGIVAPPVTLDVWGRAGLKATRSTDDPRAQTITALEAKGFTSVVAVNSELEIERYPRPGDVLNNVQILEDVSPEKATGLGVGHFVTTRHRYTTAAGGRRAPDPSPHLRPRPGINADNEFFWEGCRRHELRMQRDPATGQLFHPPGPRRDPATGRWDVAYEVVSGRGRLTRTRCRTSRRCRASVTRCSSGWSSSTRAPGWSPTSWASARWGGGNVHDAYRSH